ncbi:MAG: hypothetical protein A4E59_00117 [Syntrophorhabdus sp. PtaB.Bin027]|nr:MAG: hypothetical protein A4E59_00117 [Syntrophorhabdus sp. PtaB.Bin027]
MKIYIKSLEGLKKNVIINVLSIIGFFSLFILLIIIAITPPSKGYEISIYTIYPIYFWFFFIISITCGILILLSSCFIQNQPKWWIFGFFMLTYTNITILLLPFFRGYTTLGRGDVLTHIGLTKDILFTGNFSIAGVSTNHYPIIHILISHLSLTTGLNPELLVEIIPGFFTIFYIIGMYLLAREISTNWCQILFITAFASLLLFKHENLMFAPSVLCFYLLPFILYIIFKRKTIKQPTNFSLVLLIILILIPFFHPGEGTIFLFIILFCLGISEWLYMVIHQLRNNLKLKNARSNKFPLIIPILLLFITWFFWFSSYSSFSGTIKTVWNWLIYEIGTTTAMQYENLLLKANLSLSEILRTSISMYGHIFIYILLGSLIFFVVLIKFFASKDNVNLELFQYTILFGIFFLLLFVAFFSKVIWVEFNREMRYLIFAATILIGLGVSIIFQKLPRKVEIIILLVLLFSSAIIAIFNCYPSPIIREGNSQVTKMEIIGITHFLKFQNDKYLIDDLGLNQMRFGQLIQGTNNLPKNIRYINTTPPDHFGYQYKDYYGESYTVDRYFLETKLGRISYPEIFPDFEHLWRFTPSDFFQLENRDTSANIIYYNGEFRTYYIKAH